MIFFQIDDHNMKVINQQYQERTKAHVVNKDWDSVSTNINTQSLDQYKHRSLHGEQMLLSH